MLVRRFNSSFDHRLSSIIIQPFRCSGWGLIAFWRTRWPCRPLATTSSSTPGSTTIFARSSNGSCLVFRAEGQAIRRVVESLPGREGRPLKRLDWSRQPRLMIRNDQHSTVKQLDRIKSSNLLRYHIDLDRHVFLLLAFPSFSPSHYYYYYYYYSCRYDT